MNKQVLRLTESDLKALVEESVNLVINEIGDTKKGQRWLGMAARRNRARAWDAMKKGDFNSSDKFNKRQRDITSKAIENPNMMDRLGYGEGWREESDKISSSKEEANFAPWEQADPIEDQGEYGVESFKNNQNYSHFAVNKATNKIVNGWDYSEYDPSELRQFKKDYFDVDMVDYGFNPKDYKIVTGKFLLRQGIDPNDNNNWANS